ncbi:putative conserved membrane protein, partial [Chlamydia psittaci 84-8471/1]
NLAKSLETLFRTVISFPRRELLLIFLCSFWVRVSFMVSFSRSCLYSFYTCVFRNKIIDCTELFSSCYEENPQNAGDSSFMGNAKTYRC